MHTGNSKYVPARICPCTPKRSPIHGFLLFCAGIEKCPQAFSLSLETQRTLLLRESSQRLRPSEASQSPESCLQSDEGLTQEELKVLFECRPQRAVAFAHDDLSAFVDLEGVTHGYSFDAAMEGPLINQYGRPSL